MNPRRIAILKPSALGDIVHALPVLSALRERYPEAHIAWVVNRAYESLIAGHPHLSETIPFDRGAFRKGPTTALKYSWQFADTLRKQRFDLVIDLQGLLRTGLMCGATAAPVRIGFAHAREGSRHFYTHRIEIADAEQMHAVDRYWKVAEFLDAARGEKQFLLPLKDEELAWAKATLAPLPRPWVAVAAGARWRTKRWPTGHFAELLNRMFRDGKGSAVLVGAADDLALAQDLSARLSGPVLDLTGQTPLPRLAAVLASVDLMLANDTGPLHLAAALGRPCVAPYTCTKIVRHGPYHSFAGAVETTVPCAGSYLKQCPNNLICMPDLTPDKLWPPFAAAVQSCLSPSA